LDYYFKRRAAFGTFPALNREKFERTYQLQSIQRCFKACGSFASFYNARNDTRYLKYLSGTVYHVRAALRQFPEHAEFLDLLTSRGVFEMDFQKS
jgi:aminoglycoside/choline kinase family phosphotransferase